MADTGSVDTSIYPKLNQPAPQNPLQQIIQLGQVQDSLGKIEVGKAMQGALQPDGSVDQNVLSSMLKRTPAGAAQAIQTLDALQKMRQAGYSAEQSGLDTFQKRMAITNHLFSTLASKDSPTMQDVYNIAATALDPQLDARKYGITLPIIMNALQKFRKPDGSQMSPAEIKKTALEIQTQAASTAEILSAHAPRYELKDVGGRYELVPLGTTINPTREGSIRKTLDPRTTIATPEGERYSGQEDTGQPVVDVRGGASAPPLPRPRPDVSSGAPGATPGAVPGSSASITPTRVAAQAVPGPAPGVRAPAMHSLPPGMPEAMKLRSEALATSANRLTEAADSVPQMRAQLLNLKNFMEDFDPGIGADWSRKFKNFTLRNVPLPSGWKEAGAWFDPKSLGSQEEFAKTATQLMQQQFSTIGGTGTDAKFSSAIEASPNELLSRFGNKGIINILLANGDAIEAKNKAQQAWIKKNGPTRLDDFQIAFNGRYNPQVFMLNRMSPAERTEYLRRFEQADLDKIAEDIKQARKSIDEGGFGLTFSVPTVTPRPRRK